MCHVVANMEVEQTLLQCFMGVHVNHINDMCVLLLHVLKANHNSRNTVNIRLQCHQILWQRLHELVATPKGRCAPPNREPIWQLWVVVVHLFLLEAELDVFTPHRRQLVCSYQSCQFADLCGKPMSKGAFPSPTEHNHGKQNCGGQVGGWGSGLLGCVTGGLCGGGWPGWAQPQHPW